MMLHPEAQRKAQEEIDRVIGKDRLPDFSDREDLPYVECIFKETMRYVVPLMAVTTPHAETIPIDGTRLLLSELLTNPLKMTCITGCSYLRALLSSRMQGDIFYHPLSAESVLICGGRAMSLDERKFSEPHRFIPERYLPEPDGRGEIWNINVFFGWGRRYVHITHRIVLLAYTSWRQHLPGETFCGRDGLAGHSETLGNF